VYPTVARSFREVLAYVAGFLLGAAVAVPVAIVLGPSIGGIAVVALAGMLVAGWHGLGDQRAQVTFNGLATAAASPNSAGSLWPRHDRELTAAAERARAMTRQARESLRWNPRAAVPQSVPRPDGALAETLDVVTARTRAIARSLLYSPERVGPAPFPPSFGEDCAQVLRALADPVRELVDVRTARPQQDLTEARSHQRQLGARVEQLSADSDGSDAAPKLVRLTSDMIRELSGNSAASNDR
jgi:4-amino-4-deoxy-L-arabinose transferase-like glycosyltransferase